MNTPNILFIFSDQQRWDTLGCYNESIDFTPNLDRLAAEGVKFSSAFTCQPVCGPARACLQTGLYATQAGCYRNNIALPEGVTTIAERFNQQGFETAYIGKWHLASNGGLSLENIGRSFDYAKRPVPEHLRGGYKDYWLAADVLEFTSDGYGGHMFDGGGNRVDFKGYRVDCQTDFALEYLKNRKTDKPFFLFISYLEPHHQNNAFHFQGPEGSKERFKNYPVPEDLRRLPGNWKEEYPDYLGCCASLDYNAGRLIDALKRRGEYDSTLIVYTSDHGSHFKTRNGEYKRSCHDSSVHIPLIIRGPGFSGGKASGDMVSLTDLPVTLLRGGGIDIPPELPGCPLQRLASGNNEDWPQEVFLQISESQVGRAIRTKKWKYSVSAPGKSGWLSAGAKVYREEFLYDLENDPHELNNLVLSAQHAEVREALRQRLIERMVSAGEKAPKITGSRRRRSAPRGGSARPGC